MILMIINRIGIDIVVQKVVLTIKSITQHHIFRKYTLLIITATGYSTVCGLIQVDNIK
jgi:hypothetical protein